MSLTERLLNASTLKNVSLIDDSKVFGKKSVVTTDIPALNVALSGELDGGFYSGITTFASPSRHFKTLYALQMAKAFQKKYSDGVILLLDSEFGSPPEYLENVGIDTNRTIHIPITNLEELKFELLQLLEEIKRKDNVFILLDSLGNLASKKEVDDALDGKSVADMSRAKQIKSLFRIITPKLNLNDIPMVVINHVYESQELFSKTIMGGGTGPMLSSDTVLFITKKQEKEGTELKGYTFTLVNEKSRLVKEKSKIPILVNFDNGIDKYSALVEWALESGHIVKPKNGWYKFPDDEKTYRLKDIKTEENMLKLLNDDKFKEFVKEKYKL